MNPRAREGWIVVDCDASDATRVEIAVDGRTRDYRPAFRDYADGKRVAKVRPPAQTGRVRIFVKVDGRETEAGVISL